MQTLIPFNILGSILLILPYLLPFLFLNKMSKASKILIFTFLALNFFLEGIFLAPSFLLTYYANGQSDALILNVYFVSLVNFIFCILIIIILIIGKRSFKKNKGLDDFIWSDKDIVNEKVFLLAALFFFLIYCIFTNFEVFFDPRLTYQDLRGGIGWAWAGFIVFSSLWVATRIINGSNIAITFIIYFLFCYYSGSKALIILSIWPIISYPRVSSGARFTNILFLTPIAFFAFLILYGQFGSGVNFFTRFAGYLDMFGLSTKVYGDYLSGNIEFLWGKIYMSGFWSYIPRSIFSEKPYTYGATYINGLYYPGLAETGITPSFGMYTHNFVDFGWFGFIPAILTIDKISKLAAIYIIATGKFRKVKIYVLSYAILILPGSFFHIPPLVVVTSAYFLLQLKKNYIRNDSKINLN